MASVFGTEISTAVLLILLIAAFVVAFKVMEMVFETITIAALSGGFYLALVYTFGYPLKLERVLLFAFLGATLYMGYSFLASAWFLGTKLVEIPLNVLKAAAYPFRKLYGYLKKKRKMKQLKEEENSDEDESDVKEVVLDKVRNDD